MAPRAVPRYESVDIPAPFMDLAQRRTEFLFRVMTYGDSPMKIVLASAYLQGMNDAVDALDAKAEREKAEPPTPAPADRRRVVIIREVRREVIPRQI